MTAMTLLHCEQALLDHGWARDVLIEVDDSGEIRAVRMHCDAGDALRIRGAVVPGMPNLHSHAFQRAMAGLAEVSGPADDSFWSWRKTMYHFVSALTPEDQQAIAARLYTDMLKAGYTSVAEFHYLHRDLDGEPYADPLEMSHRVLAAASETGIRITHLPVLYNRGGFDDAPLQGAQRRFFSDPEQILAMVDKLEADYRDRPKIAFGVALHSLRAASTGQVNELIEHRPRQRPGGVIHAHVAEQPREVAECEQSLGQRPVRWLLDHHPLDHDWCLVHATHMDAREVSDLAASGATAGLCPTTEANLGDGLFPSRAYFGAAGRWGIGSDSHISLSAAEELRWLEYGRRLVDGKRCVLAGAPGRSTGATLYRAALAGGSQALGHRLGSIQTGYQADLLALDLEHPALVGKPCHSLLDSWLFGAGNSAVRDVFVGGRAVITDRRHRHEAMIQRRYRDTMKRLLA